MFAPRQATSNPLMRPVDRMIQAVKMGPPSVDATGCGTLPTRIGNPANNLPEKLTLPALECFTALGHRE